MLHTTFISYREFEYVFDVVVIDEYIRYGGTMSLGGINYNETSTFTNKESTDEYVDTAIARNIQHSLRCYQYEGHFRHLQNLYENNELTNTVNRVIEDINHRFTLEVLTHDFRSHDFGVSASNLRWDHKNPTDILDRVDYNSVIDIMHLPVVDTKSKRTVIAQPGLRYAQADALTRSLLLGKTFSMLPLTERMAVQERILSEIKGRMLEDIVLLETKIANPKKEVFVLQFPVGEFDMVVFDPETSSCQIFEIKYNDEIAQQQYRHLVNAEKFAQTEYRY